MWQSFYVYLQGLERDEFKGVRFVECCFFFVDEFCSLFIGLCLWLYVFVVNERLGKLVLEKKQFIWSKEKEVNIV